MQTKFLATACSKGILGHISPLGYHKKAKVQWCVILIPKLKVKNQAVSCIFWRCPNKTIATEQCISFGKALSALAAQAEAERIAEWKTAVLILMRSSLIFVDHKTMIYRLGMACDNMRHEWRVHSVALVSRYIRWRAARRLWRRFKLQASAQNLEASARHACIYK